MPLLDQLGVALGLATLAGVNLYLTVLVAGLAVRFGWLALIGLFPTIALFVFIGIVIFCSAFAIWLWKRIVSLRRKRQAEPAAT